MAEWLDGDPLPPGKRSKISLGLEETCPNCTALVSSQGTEGFEVEQRLCDHKSRDELSLRHVIELGITRVQGALYLGNTPAPIGWKILEKYCSMVRVLVFWKNTLQKNTCN